uniref:Transthyretin-like protein 46 n=1 Tax=Acrobeloides nanus TaxID=290746 RepID=A0A914D8T7_9BILA
MLLFGPLKYSLVAIVYVVDHQNRKMKHALLLLLVASVTLVLCDPKDSISTRATQAKGTLRCGNRPAANVPIRLFKGHTDELNQVIGTTRTDADGHFSIEGNTANFEGTEANIDPFLKIYHKCDREEKSDYRKVTLRYPREYVTIGRVPRRAYNLGTLNLQLVYPKEGTEKEVKGL